MLEATFTASNSASVSLGMSGSPRHSSILNHRVFLVIPTSPRGKPQNTFPYLVIPSSRSCASSFSSVIPTFKLFLDLSRASVSTRRNVASRLRLTRSREQKRASHVHSSSTVQEAPMRVRNGCRKPAYRRPRSSHTNQTYGTQPVGFFSVNDARITTEELRNATVRFRLSPDQRRRLPIPGGHENAAPFFYVFQSNARFDNRCFWGIKDGNSQSKSSPLCLWGSH